MDFEIREGVSYTAEQVVKFEDTAAKYGSGLVKVFATPAMIALMENASYHAVMPYLPEGFNTVGFEVNIRHLKPTPIGDTVKSTAVLEKVEGKKLTYRVEAYDSEGKIGEGSHIRYIIDSKKFMNNL